MEPVTTYEPNKTINFFYKLNLISFLLGCPHTWIENYKLPKVFTSIYGWINVSNNVLIVTLFMCIIGSFYTQNNLSDNQKFTVIFDSITIPTISFYYFIVEYHRKLVREVLFSLTVTLKSVYNDPEVERRMITKCVKYMVALTFDCLMSLFMLNAGAYMEMKRNNVPYTTIVTVYPDINDASNLANFVRGISNIIFWIFLSRILGIYFLVTPVLCCLSYQYINLQSYFYSLSKIFERHDLSQREKEDHYEKQFKLGIKLHLATLRCTAQTQAFCSAGFSGQIVFDTSILVVLMAQMMTSERNSANFLAALSIACGVLITTGFIMWNAGDITVEASHLSIAIYCSGWHNCQGHSSRRIGKMVAITMANAQKPVIMKGFGYVGLSYETYFKIVKLSYSVFSVLY